ncbi:MAG TPA: hypothetical protein VGN17_09360 [Bryobacteraceae bacterium]
MKRTIIFLIGLSLASTAFGADACDRACMRGFLTTYLDALVAHKPSAVPVAANVKFTEDNVQRKLGEGLWQTATKLRGFRQDVLDVRQSTAASLVVVEEGSMPALFTVRLKIADRKISEIETMVVRTQAEGMIFQIDAIQTPSKAMNLEPPAGQKNTREEAIAVAVKYPGGLKVGSFVTSGAEFAPDAYRFENGRLMAGPGCTFIAGCDNIKGQRLPTLAGIKYREPIVDEEQGIVLLRMNFGPGSVRGPDPVLVPWEIFKVYDGQIHAVEAFMKVFPASMGTGWD